MSVFKADKSRNELGQFLKGTRPKNYSHGISDTPFFNRYVSIRDRCNNKNNQAYKNYGGRGIKCEWQSFTSFMEDMLDSYNEHVALHGEKQTSIERINNDGNYSKANCRWATRMEQGRNTRKNVYLTFNGRTMIMKDWAKEVGLNNITLFWRLKHGWNISKALTQPKRGNL